MAFLLLAYFAGTTWLGSVFFVPLAGEGVIVVETKQEQ